MDADHHIASRDGRRRFRASRIANLCATSVLTVLVAAMAVLLIGSVLGYRALTIRSGSMTPTIRVGDVVVATSVSPLSVHPGQIITFRDPALKEQLVTHRVVSMHEVGRTVDFVTKGDANLVTEHWSVPITGHLGRKVFVIPGLGRIAAALSSRAVRVTALALSALLIAALGFRRIWREPAISVSPQHR